MTENEAHNYEIGREGRRKGRPRDQYTTDAALRGWDHEDGCLKALEEVNKRGIGDVTSNERGTGARHNAGKPPMELIPFRSLVAMCGASARLLDFAESLADFEERLVDADAFTEVWRSLPDNAPELTARVFAYGAEKYAPWNWAKGMPWSVPLACIKRHWIELVRGEGNDHESGLSHWGHIGCNLVMLDHFVRYYPEGDDRPPASIFQTGETK